MPVINKYFTETQLKDIYSQEDPIIQYYIVRKSLEMSPGKIAVQVAHCAYIFAKYHIQVKDKEYSICGPHGGKEVNRIKLVDKWEETSFTKIVKQASDSKFDKIKEEFDNVCITDAGKTEVPTGSETVLALFPMIRSETPSIIWKLRNL